MWRSAALIRPSGVSLAQAARKTVHTAPMANAAPAPCDERVRESANQGVSWTTSRTLRSAQRAKTGTRALTEAHPDGIRLPAKRNKPKPAEGDSISTKLEGSGMVVTRKDHL